MFPVEGRPGLGSAERLNVEVTSTDLQSGVRVVWQDSVTADSAGQYHHVFWSGLRVELGGTYRIEARRLSDGAASFADARIPPPVGVQVDESRAPIVNVLVEGEGVRLLKPEAVYDVHKGPPTLRFEVSYEGRERAVEGGWQVPFNLIVDAFEVNYLYNGIVPALGGMCRVDFVFLRGLALRTIVGDTVWNPPGGILDPNILSQRGVLSNVINGFGFVGGGYELNVPLDLSRETVESACFRYDP